MAFYVVQYTYVDNAEAVAAGRPAHREYLQTLADAGQVRAAGPYPGADPDTALLIFRAESEKVVQDLIEADPFSQDRLIARHSIHEWRPWLGVFADEID